jgi:anti-anti-sigma factor
MTGILTKDPFGRRARGRATPPGTGFRRAEPEIATDWQDFDFARVLVSGDIDAAHTCEVRDYVLSKVLVCHRLVLDLTRVRFFSCEGYRMLGTLKQRCTLADVEFKVLYGPHVTTTIGVCEQADQHARTAVN